MPLFSVIIVEFSINACLNPSTKYVKGKHLNTLTKLSESIFKFQIIGVNHINSCIKIPNNWAKSGTKVVNADVKRVNEIIKHNKQNNIYITFKTFGTKPYMLETTIAIIIKNIPTKHDDARAIIGIISTGKTTFFTR